MLLISEHPRHPIAGGTPVRVSRLQPCGRLQHLAMYLPAAAAHLIGVGSQLTGYEVRVGGLADAHRDWPQ